MTDEVLSAGSVSELRGSDRDGDVNEKSAVADHANVPERRRATPRKKRRGRALAIGVTVVALIGGGAVLWSKRAAGNSGTVTEGAVATIARGELRTAIDEVGSIEPLRKVEIKAKIAGQVGRVLVDVGQRVKAGDVLLELDPVDIAREVAQGEARIGVTEAQVRALRDQVAFKRKAHQNGVLADLELATAEGEVARLEAQAKVDAAEQASRRDRLSYTRVRAPIDGVILARNVQPGEMVTPGVAAMVEGKPLLVVAQVEKLLVRAELNQLDVARLALGQKVDVRVDALPGRMFQGEVYRVAAMAQKSERRKDSTLLVFPVDVIVDASQAGAADLRPGMMADIKVALEARSNVLVAPLEAVVRAKGGKTQLRKIAADGKGEELVDVSIGLQNDKSVEIVSGIAEGEKIRVNPGEGANPKKDD